MTRKKVYYAYKTNSEMPQQKESTYSYLITAIGSVSSQVGDRYSCPDVSLVERPIRVFFSYQHATDSLEAVRMQHTVTVCNVQLVQAVVLRIGRESTFVKNFTAHASQPMHCCWNSFLGSRHEVLMLDGQ
jgi:hypothetical protein